MIPNGAVITYTGTWVRETLRSADSTVGDVSPHLTEAGIALRGSPRVDASLFSSLPFSGGQFQVTFQAQVENGLGFDKPEDLLSIIDNIVFQETGNKVVSSSLPYTQVGGGAPTPTGQPGVDVSGGTPKCLAGSSTDTSGSFNVSCWWTNLTSKGLSTVGLLALLIVAGVGIFIFYGPQRVRVTT
jgi:hypothetical protein